MSIKTLLKKSQLVTDSYAALFKFKAITEVDLLNAAIDIGLKNGHSDFTKFIIVSRGRSGTNFLRGMLNSHGQIACFGEVFRQYPIIGWGLPGYRKEGKQKSLIQTDPIGFLDSQVFRKAPKNRKAVGFKIFYYHAQNAEWNPVWQHLQQMNDLHVIHLKRTNRLATYLSTRIALETKVWEVKSSRKSVAHGALTLEYEDCLEFFEKTEELETQADLLFEKAKKIEVTYEALSANTDNEMTRILGFLGVEQQNVKPVNYKQNVKHLSEGISNYAELKEQFIGTPWQRYFED